MRSLRRTLSAVSVLAVCALSAVACTTPPGTTPAGSAPSAATSAPGAGSSGSASPNADASGSASGTPDPSVTPGSSPSAGSSTTPAATPSGSASQVASSSPSQTQAATQAPTATCSAVTLLRVERVDTEPRRTTEVVTLVSDGRNLTTGTRENSEFIPANLTSPNGTSLNDRPTVETVLSLISQSSKNRVLLDRPEGPDADASASKKPFSSPGNYVVFNASAPLVAQIVVSCGGEEQTWIFNAEADASSGVVNCAVEPPKSQSLPRIVYQSYC